MPRDKKIVKTTDPKRSRNRSTNLDEWYMGNIYRDFEFQGSVQPVRTPVRTAVAGAALFGAAGASMGAIGGPIGMGALGALGAAAGVHDVIKDPDYKVPAGPRGTVTVKKPYPANPKPKSKGKAKPPVFSPKRGRE
jgi:hypothetical protein